MMGDYLTALFFTLGGVAASRAFQECPVWLICVLFAVGYGAAELIRQAFKIIT